MATYILTAKLTETAVRGLLDQPEDRRAALDSLVTAAGGDMTEYYFTSGETDLLMILDAETAEVPAKVGMVMAAAGMASDTTSTRAWTMVEYADVCRDAARASAAYRPPGA